MLMTSRAPLSVLLVLSLGAFSGGVVKGITGFGNAIINLLVWVAFTAAGVNAGPLQLAVLTDSFGCVVCSIPLLVMTSAHKNADWRIVIGILLFASAGSPLGAAVLMHLDVRWIELAMACVLLMVICLHVKLHEKLRDKLKKWRDNRRSSSSSGRSALPSDNDHDPEVDDNSVSVRILINRCHSEKKKKTGTIPASLVVVGGVPPQNSGQLSSGCSGPAAESEVSATAATGVSQKDSASVSLSVALVRCGTDTGCWMSGDPNPTASYTQYVQHLSCEQQLELRQDCQHVHVERGGIVAEPTVAAVPAAAAAATSDTEPLLEPGTLASDAPPSPPPSLSAQAATHRPSWAGGSTSKSSGSESSGSVKELKGPRFRRWLQQQDWKEMRQVFFVASGAGFTSGVMGGMTGIGGPPLMYMYEKLKVAKEVVRGSNAVCNVLQVRIVSYIIMGAFKREDVMIYAVTSAVGLAGVILGNCLACHLDQKGFSRVLVALMIICCLLLFASAAGLKGGHAE